MYSKELRQTASMEHKSFRFETIAQFDASTLKFQLHLLNVQSADDVTTENKRRAAEGAQLNVVRGRTFLINLFGMQISTAAQTVFRFRVIYRRC